MGSGETDEDYKNFDPKKFWAVANSEKSGPPPKIKEWLRAEKLAEFCSKERAASYILEILKLTPAALSHSLNLIRNKRGFLIESRKEADETYYKIFDRRSV